MRIEGPLRVPVSAKLRERVEALLERGERRILLDLARVSTVDAAGLGELVGAYNVAAAVDGVVRVSRVPRRVRALLDVARLSDLLTAGA